MTNNRVLSNPQKVISSEKGQRETTLEFCCWNSMEQCSLLTKLRWQNEKTECYLLSHFVVDILFWCPEDPHLIQQLWTDTSRAFSLPLGVQTTALRDGDRKSSFEIELTLVSTAEIWYSSRNTEPVANTVLPLVALWTSLLRQYLICIWAIR